jgi:flagellar basal-body rod protein FlgG
MLEGLYSAASGMAAQQERLDALSNDVANANTPGYKARRVAFRDLVYESPGMAAGPTTRVGSGAAAAVIGATSDQGVLNQTGNPLDLALTGDGFFRVRRPDGTLALTRDGSFHLDARGRIVTALGDEVSPGITVPAGTDLSKLSIAADGTVSSAGRRLGRLDIVTVTAVDQLQPIGRNLFAVTPGSGPAQATNKAVVQQSVLEDSNVDIGDAMASMIDAQRSFQLASRAVQMQDQMLEVANGVKR